MRSPRWWFSAATLLTAMFLATACGGGGGGGGTSGDDTSNDLVLLDLNVEGFDGVALNTVLEASFSEDLDPDSVRPETFQIRQGPQFGSQVFGNFRIDGARVFFYPRLPVDDKLETSGFQPGTDYKVFLPSVPKVAVVRNFTADRTVREAELYFKTAVADDPDLFIDNFLDPGPPRILSVNPVEGAVDVPADAVITLTFNRRALHPMTVSADTIKLTMIERQGQPNRRSIQGTPLLTQSLEAVSVEFRPLFPLPDEAKFELTVSNRVEDLVGDSVPSFSSTFTIRDEAPRLGTFRLEFDDAEKTDLLDGDESTASWNGLVTDALAAIFTAAGGSGKSGDLITSADMNLTPFNTAGVEIGVWGNDGLFYDIYNFRKFDIGDGATIRFQPSTGSHSVIVRSVFPMQIDGVVTVTGGTGDNGTGGSSYNYKSNVPDEPGGTTGPGGGDGGDGYGGSTAKTKPHINTKNGVQTLPVRNGNDSPFGGYGGKGGLHGTGFANSRYYYSYGGGGGGGGSRLAGVKGDPAAYQWGDPTYQNGKGGAGGSGRGGNFERVPNAGGAGGGAGGTGYYVYVSGSYKQNYIYRSGGGGGGGGGGIWFQCASTINVGTTGKIRADGGAGGKSGTFYYCASGSGGGGAGGSIKISSVQGIDFASGATASVDGGAGGGLGWTYTFYQYSKGGAGGEGFLRFEAPDTNNISWSAANLTYTPPSLGEWKPVGGGIPSIGQTKWANLGVFDPMMRTHKPLEDRVAELYNDAMEIWVQMSDEHPTKLGEPDLTDMDVANDSSFNTDTLSKWVPISQVQNLTGEGYQFIRVRVFFQLDSVHSFDDPLPYLDRLDVKFDY